MDTINYIEKGATVTGDLSTTTAVLAAVSGKKFWLRSIDISASAALNVIIEDSDGTDVVGPIYLAANGNVSLGPWEPGEVAVVADKGINALASAADATSVTVTAWMA